MAAITLIHFFLSLFCFSCRETQSTALTSEAEVVVQYKQTAEELGYVQNLIAHLDSIALLSTNIVGQLSEDSLSNADTTVVDASSLALTDSLKVYQDKIAALELKLSKEVEKNQLLQSTVDSIDTQLELLKESVRKEEGKLNNSSPEITKTAVYGPGNYTYGRSSYAAYLTNGSKERIQLHLNDALGKNFGHLNRLKSSLEADSIQVLMLTNGGMYTPELQPQGLYVEKSDQHTPLNKSKGPKEFTNFYFKPNGVFFIDSNGVGGVLNSSDFASLKLAVAYATQSGPMLLIDGKAHRGFNPRSSHRKIRSGVGINEMGEMIFAISNNPVTFYEFALFFREVFKCKNALYLDGTVSRMFMNGREQDLQAGPFGVMVSVTAK